MYLLVSVVSWVGVQTVAQHTFSLRSQVSCGFHHHASSPAEQRASSEKKIRSVLLGTQMVGGERRISPDVHSGCGNPWCVLYSSDARRPPPATSAGGR